MKIVMVIFILVAPMGDGVRDKSSRYLTLQYVADGETAWRAKVSPGAGLEEIRTLDATVANVIDLATSDVEAEFGESLIRGYIVESPGGLAGLGIGLKKKRLNGVVQNSDDDRFYWQPDPHSVTEREDDQIIPPEKST